MRGVSLPDSNSRASSVSPARSGSTTKNTPRASPARLVSGWATMLTSTPPGRSTCQERVWLSPPTVSKTRSTSLTWSSNRSLA